ncbi:hypothetical protein J6590_017507 [Homalodisca vitripennis]|nr:hypothetical protein J6590_017507 [Homalodisca vitripennis]
MGSAISPELRLLPNCRARVRSGALVRKAGQWLLFTDTRSSLPHINTTVPESLLYRVRIEEDIIHSHPAVYITRFIENGQLHKYRRSAIAHSQMWAYIKLADVLRSGVVVIVSLFFDWKIKMDWTEKIYRVPYDVPSERWDVSLRYEFPVLPSSRYHEENQRQVKAPKAPRKKQSYDQRCNPDNPWRLHHTTSGGRGRVVATLHQITLSPAAGIFPSIPKLADDCVTRILTRPAVSGPGRYPATLFPFDGPLPLHLSSNVYLRSVWTFAMRIRLLTLMRIAHIRKAFNLITLPQFGRESRVGQGTAAWPRNHCLRERSLLGQVIAAWTKLANDTDLRWKPRLALIYNFRDGKESGIN